MREGPFSAESPSSFRDAVVYFVYVLRNPAGRLYVGFTADLPERLRRHQAGEAGWTRSRGPWTLVHQEQFLVKSRDVV